ncbi:hypothetical protein [Cetobacterium sp.]|uniref:hypothetical protein n=1 Tax=Cetobacterium sp. TaxID=2071632 RepID=UPI0025C20340|nr:hypothetical protein [Cetobacterium sp.]
MKKILLGFLVLSSLTFAKNDEIISKIEKKLETKHAYITDGKNKIEVDDIDLALLNNKPFVFIEVETLFGEGAWKDFNQTEINNFVKAIADDVRTSLNINEKVNISIILDPKIGDKKLLLEGTY